MCLLLYSPLFQVCVVPLLPPVGIRSHKDTKFASNSRSVGLLFFLHRLFCPARATPPPPLRSLSSPHGLPHRCTKLAPLSAAQVTSPLPPPHALPPLHALAPHLSSPSPPHFSSPPPPHGLPHRCTGYIHAAQVCSLFCSASPNPTRPTTHIDTAPLCPTRVASPLHGFAPRQKQQESPPLNFEGQTLSSEKLISRQREP